MTTRRLASGALVDVALRIGKRGMTRERLHVAQAAASLGDLARPVRDRCSPVTVQEQARMRAGHSITSDARTEMDRAVRAADEALHAEVQRKPQRTPLLRALAGSWKRTKPQPAYRAMR